MCGINGIYNFQNSKTIQKTEIEKSRDTMIHRGPNGCGIYISPDKKIGFGHRRLAIIDLSDAGSQPMTNEDKTIWITYNGEIYNFKELKEQLIKKSHKFISHSDTEVIIHSYEEYGFDCVNKFNGMFAFAIWDENKKILFAARDHMGVKPFYYAFQNGSFYFASEPKAILACPSFKKELEEKNISYYLTFGCLPSPFTLFKDIFKLAPANYLIIDKTGKPEIKEYWNPLGRQNKISKNESEEYYSSETKRILEDSINAQMVSDVPFGCFLSGGIDSSTNAALMSKALGEPVETFSIGSEGYEKYNEFEYSRKTADLLGARKHEMLIVANDLMNFLPQYAHYADDPNGDYVCFLVYYLSKFIRDNGVIVAQVGEGSDEIFAGYDPYLLSVNLYEKIWRHLEKTPSFVKKIPYLLSRSVPLARFDFQKEYLRRLAVNEEPFWGSAIAFTTIQKQKLLTKEFAGKLEKNHEYNVVSKYYQDLKKIDPEADFLEKLTYLELKTRLAELLLMRVDKMSMAHSIEARVPFLDYRLVELAMKIPQAIKLKNNTTKYILKKAVSGIIPDEIIWRKKQGFGAPVSEWLKNEKTGKQLLNIIYNSKLKERNILNYDNINEILNLHRPGEKDHSFRLWNLITLSLWYDYWFK